ncbi:MAG: hypothetical protein HRT92_06070 [Piscirickettsiaceae bacterium]|nr:hypothetical protein [Piscirickettsiaceae bacterium]
MTSNELLRITVKLVGLALLINGAIEASASVPMIIAMEHNELGLPAQAFLLSAAMPILFGLLLWLAPASIANMIIKNELPHQEINPLLEGMEVLAIRLMGLFIFYQGLIDLLQTFLSYRQYSSLNLDYSAENHQIIYLVILCQILLATGLIIGAHGIKSIFHKIRYAS